MSKQSINHKVFNLSIDFLIFLSLCVYYLTYSNLTLRDASLDAFSNVTAR